MKLVFNRSQNAVVYGDGLMVTAGEFAYVDDDKYRKIGEYIDTGDLVEKPIPQSMPPNVSEAASAALRMALDDRAAAQDVSVGYSEETSEDDADKTDRSVRNTERNRNARTRKGA